MKVAIFNHHDFSSNSGIHVFNLANRLTTLGVDVTAYVPHDPNTVHNLGDPRFEVRGAGDASAERVDLVHAWTPRHVVRTFAMPLIERYAVPYVVHLEDNEDVVTTYGAGLRPEKLRELSPTQLTELVRNLPAASPSRYDAFLEDANGVTAVVERLFEFAPAGVPRALLWPAYEPELFRPMAADDSLRRELGIHESEHVVVYAGNVHAANAEEVRALYFAIALVNTRGRPLRLVRLGDDYVDFLGSLTREAGRYEIRVPYVARTEVPRYFALADLLVQPGRPGPFNDYRFPSKVPEFFAMGKPVILPATNIGLEVEEGEEAMLLRRGDPLELAQLIEAVLADPVLRRKLGAGARRFAEAKLSWDRASEAAAHLYAEVLARRERRSA